MKISHDSLPLIKVERVPFKVQLNPFTLKQEQRGSKCKMIEVVKSVSERSPVGDVHSSLHHS